MPSNPTNPKPGNSMTRTMGPMILLAIALAHGALTGAAPPQSPTSAPPTPQLTATPGIAPCGGSPNSPPCQAPYPMLTKGHPVAWWFVFKFNASAFPQCGAGATRACPFGGTPQPYKDSFGQQFVYASSEAPTLKQGDGCTGDTTSDPVGATFDEVYNGGFYYVVWNDQFKGDPIPDGDGTSGHSKGIVAWNDAGEGLVMQVSTPSWPAAGSSKVPRKTGNTLGCVVDNDVLVSQHFFALSLNHDDLVAVLKALANASIVTHADPNNKQLVSNGGPADVSGLVASLGEKSKNTTVLTTALSSGVQLISKPSDLHVPPWQMVSAVLGGVPLRAATWWMDPEIPTTDTTAAPGCWSSSLSTPGPVQIATSGTWGGKTFGLQGGLNPNGNHAKVGVSTSGTNHYSIFGDMNQQGTLSGNCASSQNQRGGVFYVVNNPELSASITSLLTGTTAPTQPTAK